LPRTSNFVDLSPTLLDSSGVPAARLNYRYDENSLKNLEFNARQAADVFRSAGALEVEMICPTGSNAHMMGTARMGVSAEDSVVDAWCMSHDVANLGIFDASVFVTSAPVNPTSTVCALALRASEHLAENLASIPRATPRQLGTNPRALGTNLRAVASDEFDAYQNDPEVLERFARLRKARLRLAQERQLPPYCICHDRTLKLIARYAPRDAETLEQIKGMGPHKVRMYGERLLQAVKEN